MFTCRVKFNDKGKIECCSQVLCVNCKEKDRCEELDLYIHDQYEDVESCMKSRSYKRVNRRVRQRG